MFFARRSRTIRTQTIRTQTAPFPCNLEFCGVLTQNTNSKCFQMVAKPGSTSNSYGKKYCGIHVSTRRPRWLYIWKSYWKAIKPRWRNHAKSKTAAAFGVWKQKMRFPCGMQCGRESTWKDNRRRSSEKISIDLQTQHRIFHEKQTEQKTAPKIASIRQNLNPTFTRDPRCTL